MPEHISMARAKRQSNNRKHIFQKGNTFGTGRPKIPDDLKLLIKSTSTQTRRDIIKVWRMKEEELKLALENESSSAGLKLIASCMHRGIEEGDIKIFEKFLDRLIGKAKEKLDTDLKDWDKTVDSKEEALSRLESLMVTEREIELH